MRYIDVMNHALREFTCKGANDRLCSLNQYQLLKDNKSGRFYFKNESYNQTVIGYIKRRSNKVFICMGVLEKEEEMVVESVFFCQLLGDLFGTEIVQKCYIEQGFVEEKGEKERGIVNYGIDEQVLIWLRSQTDTLYDSFYHYDTMNLPSNLELVEKSTVRKGTLIQEKALEIVVRGCEVSNNSQLVPLSDMEREIVEMIYRKTKEEKRRLKNNKRQVKTLKKVYAFE